MSTKKVLEQELNKHTKKMRKVFKNLRLLMKEESFKELYDSAFSYFSDSKHFHKKGMIVQAFEALIISWAYIDAGLKLEVFELTDESLNDYFTA